MLAARALNKAAAGVIGPVIGAVTGLAILESVLGLPCQRGVPLVQRDANPQAFRSLRAGASLARQYLAWARL